MIKSLGVLAAKSSTRTVAVAFEVPPVIVSPAVNLPKVPVLLSPSAPSKTILFPSTSKTLDGEANSKRRLSISTVRRSSPDSRY